MTSVDITIPACDGCFESAPDRLAGPAGHPGGLIFPVFIHPNVRLNGRTVVLLFYEVSHLATPARKPAVCIRSPRGIVNQVFFATELRISIRRQLLDVRSTNKQHKRRPMHNKNKLGSRADDGPTSPTLPNASYGSFAAFPAQSLLGSSLAPGTDRGGRGG